jgi:hypothetical protein
MHYPLLTTTDGVSLERIDPGRPSDDAGNWHSASSTCGYATPGYQNSQFGITKNTLDEIAVSPEVFSPDMDGFDDVLSISCHFNDAGSNASVTIFDASGHQVRMLINRELCGASCVFTWDGINDDNRKATIGRYIILIEVFDLQGNVRKIKKSAVLGGKL